MTRTSLSPVLAGLTLALTLLAPHQVPAQDAAGGAWRPPDLVDAVASFGAVAHDGALYVYGGHVGRTHVHSMENISPGFRRLVLEPDRTWEELARGPLLQGAALVSDGAAIYRVGGMTASNATAAEPEVLRSSRSAARYSIAEDRWEPLPDLPAGRSSHDAVVAGGVLYVVGGWELRGPDEDAVWAATVLALDLDDATGWRSIPAPFKRRALAAGTAGGRIHALGGLTPDSGPQLRVDVLDIASGEWSRGPDLPPAGNLQGFGVAAASHDRVFMSQADGKVYSLDAGTDAWKLAANLTDRRFMHRLAPFGDRMLAVGGSGRSGHLATIEVVSTDAEPADEPENAAPERGATRWPGFLGGRDTNVSRAARLPLTWSDDSVAWRITTPGFGQSSPVIWDDTVFLTSLEGRMKETLFITAVDLEDGAERWRRTFDAAEAFEWNDYVSKGAPTPAVDGERLYAYFDSGDLLALTHDGETVWRRKLGAEYGTVGGNHGVGNSILLTDDAVVVLQTRRAYSYLLAVDPATGETLWKADREPGVAWSTPALTPDGSEIVVSASGRIEGFDAGTGERRWFFEDLRGNHVPSPTFTDELVIVGGMAVQANLALRRGRTGALDGGDVAWTAGSGSNFASPFVYRDCVYWVNPAGAARCLAPESGAVRWTHRLPDSITQVLRRGARGGPTNHLSVDAPVTGVAVVNDAIVIRAGTEVIRVGRPVE